MRLGGTFALAAAVGLFAMPGCAQPGQGGRLGAGGAPPHAVLSFETLGRGFDVNSGYDTAAELVIRDDAAWASLWQKVSARVHPPSDWPRVDFEANMVLAVFQGACPTGGYGVSIESVIEEDGRVKAVVRKRTPGPWTMRTQALTAPAHLIKVPRRDLDVCFEVWMLQHPQRSGHRLEDGTVDPDVYKELQYSPDGRARVAILLQESSAAEVQGELSADEFEPGPGFAQGSSLSGRISRAGVAQLEHDPRIRGILFEGPFSKPDEFTLDQGCEEGPAHAQP